MTKLSVLHVNFNEVSGGAARAMMRLHQALLHSNIDSKILLLDKESDDLNALSYFSSKSKLLPKFRSFFDRLFVSVFHKKRKNKFSLNWLPSRIIQKIDKLNPDIIHLHWINDGQMSINSIKNIKHPVVWTLLDMWPLTGGCHYSGACKQYETICHRCPTLNSRRKYDLSYLQFHKKKIIYNKKKINFVAISQWLKVCADKSLAIPEVPITVIPPCLDTNTFKPVDKKTCREMFSFPEDKKLILFGAMNSVSDERKGYHLLLQALEKLEQKLASSEFEVIVFGATHGQKIKNIKIHYVGRLSSDIGVCDDVSLVALYSAADVMIVPSLQEAFGQTASEALACGTPVVSFNETGVADIVEHLSSGYLARHGDADDLAEGVAWVLNNGQADEISRQARKQAVEKFSNHVVANQYIDLYTQITT